MFLQSHGSITAQQTTAEGSAYTTLLADSFHSSAQVRTKWHGADPGATRRPAFAFYGTSESAPNFTRVRRSDSSQSRFATVSSSALFGIDAAFGYPFASMKPSGP